MPTTKSEESSAPLAGVVVTHARLGQALLDAAAGEDGCQIDHPTESCHIGYTGHDMFGSGFQAGIVDVCIIFGFRNIGGYAGSQKKMNIVQTVDEPA